MGGVFKKQILYRRESFFLRARKSNLSARSPFLDRLEKIARSKSLFFYFCKFAEIIECLDYRGSCKLRLTFRQQVVDKF